MIIYLKKDKSPDELIEFLSDKKHKYEPEWNLVISENTDLPDFDCVESVIDFREQHKQIPTFEAGGVTIGGNKIVMIGGPCSIESGMQMDEVCSEIHRDVDFIRGGSFKPRTSPYAFQGLGFEGLDILEDIKEKYNKPVITEVLTMNQFYSFSEIDIAQVGTRNMQNYELLKALGKTDKPILLKRGFSSTVEEWIMAAEYIIAGGNNKVILCERGIRTFENHTRNTLDISAVVAAKKLTNLPVFVDPSHASGKWDFVEALSKASIAAGCDGLMIEIHQDPENALSDGAQSIKPKRYKEMLKNLKKVAFAVGRKI